MNPTRAHGLPSPMAGFSLTETLVVLALVGILLGLAVPGMGALRVRQQLQSVAEDIWNSLMLARSQAMVQQERVVLCPAASATAWVMRFEADSASRICSARKPSIWPAFIMPEWLSLCPASGRP